MRIRTDRDGNWRRPDSHFQETLAFVLTQCETDPRRAAVPRDRPAYRIDGARQLLTPLRR